MVTRLSSPPKPETLISNKRTSQQRFFCYLFILNHYREDTVFIKFVTQNWVNSRVVVHYYQGTWQTVLEDGLYKMNQSKIVEVDDPDWDWFYE
ncbi:hypothetical protein KJ953_02225 [Patescibacteria group bacterium]|nr:hypothetical protein [Patescibacteria group bacterium]